MKKQTATQLDDQKLQHKLDYWRNQLINTKIRRTERGQPEWSMSKQEYETKIQKIQTVLTKLNTKPEWMNKD
jgi:hypothetical protein